MKISTAKILLNIFCKLSLVFSMIGVGVSTLQAQPQIKLGMVYPLIKQPSKSDKSSAPITWRDIDVIINNENGKSVIEDESLLSQALSRLLAGVSSVDRIQIETRSDEGLRKKMQFLISQYDQEVIAISFLVGIVGMAENKPEGSEMFRQREHPLSIYLKTYFPETKEIGTDTDAALMEIQAQMERDFIWESEKTRKFFESQISEIFKLAAGKANSFQFLMENYSYFSQPLLDEGQDRFDRIVMDELLIQFGWIVDSLRRIFKAIDKMEASLAPKSIDTFLAIQDLQGSRVTWLDQVSSNFWHSNYITESEFGKGIKRRLDTRRYKLKLKQLIFKTLIDGIVGGASADGRPHLGNLVKKRLQQIRSLPFKVGRGKTMEWEDSGIKFDRQTLTIAAFTFAPGGWPAAGLLKATVMAGLLEESTINDLIFIDDPDSEIKVPVKWLRLLVDMLIEPERGGKATLCEKILKEKKLF